MKAFWWFQDNAVAGMARPGFNSCRWFDLPFDEAVVMGWLGQHSSGPISLEAFKVHLESYLPRVRSFYQIDDKELSKLMTEFADPKVLESIVGRLSERSKFLTNVSVQDGHLNFEINRTQLNQEIQFLKSLKISHIVSLTEDHHLADELKDQFELTHISITDMLAPTLEQAQVLAEILDQSERSGERVAVHCLAGIGRTSTMLMAAEILREKRSLQELLTHLKARNPYYAYTGPQADFIRSLVSKTE